MSETSSVTGMSMVAIAIPAAMIFLMSSLRHSAAVREGRHWLEYGWPMKATAILMMCAMLVCFALFVFVDDEKEQVAGFMMGLLFAAIGLPLLIESFGTRLAFDDSKLYCYSGWRRDRDIFWHEIVSAEYSKSNSWWVLQTQGHGKVRIHTLLSGRDSFFVALNRKTGIKPGGEYADVF